MRRARETGLDLVEVAPAARPPVCRIMDYGKWRYQQQKKEDKSRAHRGGQLKEVKLRTVRIGDHDLDIKINRAKEFLKEGNKVQFTLQFRGREMTHLELGRAIFIKVKQALTPVSKVERDAKMEGRRMILILQPDHKSAAPPAKGAPAGERRPPTMNAGSGLGIPVPQPAPSAPVPEPASAG
jgi:translation initiation factor IF-3